jgi:hypothetical protein
MIQTTFIEDLTLMSFDFIISICFFTLDIILMILRIFGNMLIAHKTTGTLSVNDKDKNNQRTKKNNQRINYKTLKRKFQSKNDKLLSNFNKKEQNLKQQEDNLKKGKDNLKRDKNNLKKDINVLERDRNNLIENRNSLASEYKLLAIFKKKYGDSEEHLNHIEFLETTLLKKNNIVADDLDDVCPICLEGLNECTGDKLLKLHLCNHTLHTDCAKRWFSKKKNCPECRSTIAYKDLDKVQIN